MELTREALQHLSKDALIDIILAMNVRLQALEAEVRELKRAKAPFSKGTRQSAPKKPGRRAGQGLFKTRPAPEIKPTDRVIEVTAPLAADDRRCPQCDVPLVTTAEVVTSEDMPTQPVREITRIQVEVGVCPRCGLRRRGQHAKLGAHQCGANAHQVGPRVLAHALALHYDSGLPLRRVPQVMAQTTGITLTQSALSQSAGKLCEDGGLLHAHYTELRSRVAGSAVVNTDDTGWRVCATLAFLMGFFTDDTAYYQIRTRHRHQEVLEVLGKDFGGKLGTDRGKSYEARAMDQMAMQKCLSHLLKNLSEVEARKSGRAKVFSRELKATLREALAHWQAYQRGECGIESYRERGREIAAKLDHQLRERALSDADNRRLLRGIAYQHERGRLALFLKHPEIEPTNNRAERGLRPAVIARKVSQCSKNERGAQTYAVMKTLFTTLRLRCKDTVSAFASLLRGASLPTACAG